MVGALINGCVNHVGNEAIQAEPLLVISNTHSPSEAIHPSIAHLTLGTWYYHNATPAKIQISANDSGQQQIMAVNNDLIVFEVTPYESSEGTSKRDIIRLKIGPEREELLQIDDQGNLVLLETIDHANHAQTVFDPPLIYIHVNQKPNHVYRQSATVTVWSTHKQDKKEDEGTATFETLFDAIQVIEIQGLGKQTTYRIRRQLEIDLRRADVSTSSVIWYAQNLGAVIRQIDERVTILGPLGWQVESLLILKQFKQQNESPPHRQP